jgi:hypothetical protein
MRVLIGLATAIVLSVPALAAAPSLPGAPGCPVFPADNALNQRVDRRPVAPDSARLIATIGASTGLHPDFGTVYGIPYQVVGHATKRSRVTFDDAAESDRGPYPIPAHPRIEHGSDRHLLMVDRDACRLYELFAAERRDGRWHAGSGAIWGLRSNRLRPRGWTSADAAGLPILPGLARYDEVVTRGVVRHAFRFTVTRTRHAYVAPARHFASQDTDPTRPPMGMRVRLRGDYDTTRFPPQARVILDALKAYGMILADNGGDWFLNGAPDPRWDDEQLAALKRVKVRDFEVVRMGEVVTR